MGVFSQSLSRVQLCSPMACSPLGFSVHGIFQARIVEWVAISCFRESYPGIKSMSSLSPALAGGFFITWSHLGNPSLITFLFLDVCSIIQLFVTPWTVTHQAPLSMGFSRQENWSKSPSLPHLGAFSWFRSCLSHQLGWLQRMKWLSPLLLHSKMSMEFCESWGRIWNTSEAMLWKTPSVPSAIFYR